MTPVAVPEPLPDAPAVLGALGPALRRLATLQGQWPPRVPAHPRVALLPPDGDLATGRAAADALADEGGDLLVLEVDGDPVPGLVLLAALLDVEPVAAVGTAGGPDWARRLGAVRAALPALRPHADDPAALLQALADPGLAHATGLLGQAAARRTPVLLGSSPARSPPPWLPTGSPPGRPAGCSRAARAPPPLPPGRCCSSASTPCSTCGCPAPAGRCWPTPCSRPRWGCWMADGLRLALTTLTVLPVRGPAALDRRTAGRAMVLAPLVGLLLGGIAAGVLVGLDAVTTGPPLLPAVAALAVLAALTRGLHLDGLADLADGLGSYAGPARAREVMKQPDVGALGLAAVVLVLLLQAGALVACVEAGRGVTAVVLAAVAGRLAVALACTPGTPAAAPGGLGALVAGTVRPAVPLVTAVVVGAAACAATRDVVPAVALAAALLAARVLRRHAVRRLEGITGDVLGALVETATTVVLVVLALDV